VHGTTLATNVILERRGARVAFVTTAGFGDLLRLGREARVEGDRYDLFFRTPDPPVTHALTFDVAERVGPTGEVLVPLSEADAAELAELGLRCPIDVMESSGGVMAAARAARRPVATVESGGAAGVIAAGFVGRLLGTDQVISFDMGGTTAKAGVVRGGRPDVTHDFQVGGKGSFGGSRPGTGFPVKIPVIDLAEVGAGGGSVAWVDAGGALRVG